MFLFLFLHTVVIWLAIIIFTFKYFTMHLLLESDVVLAIYETINMQFCCPSFPRAICHLNRHEKTKQSYINDCMTWSNIPDAILIMIYWFCKLLHIYQSC